MVNESYPSLPQRKILRLPAVKAITGLSRSSIYAFMVKGMFPTPISLGRRAVGWDASEINDWIETRLTNSRHPKNDQKLIKEGC